VYIFIFVCTNVGLLPPGESPIAVNNNNINNNSNNNNNNNNNNKFRMSPTSYELPPMRGLSCTKYRIAPRSLTFDEEKGSRLRFTVKSAFGC
jgi:hypothetical protein